MDRQAHLPAASGNRPAQQNKSGSLPWTWADLLIVLALCLGSIAAIARFWDPGISSQYDMLMGIYRVILCPRDTVALITFDNDLAGT